MKIGIRLVPLLCVAFCIGILSSSSANADKKVALEKEGSPAGKVRKKKRTFRRYRRSRHRKEYHKVRKAASKEVKDWLHPLYPSTDKTSGALSVSYWLRAFIAARWGVRMSPGANKRMKAMQGYLRSWRFAALYRSLRYKRISTRFFSELKDSRYFFSAPKPNVKWVQGKSKGMFEIKIAPLKRRRSRSLRPYLINTQLRVGVAKLLGMEIDTVMRTFIEKLTNQNISDKVLPGFPTPFPAIKKGSHSRKVGNYLFTRIPRAIQILDRYFKVTRLIEPHKNGLYRLDLKAYWNFKTLGRDYPRWAKRLQDPKSALVFRTEMLDSKYRRWMLWTYNRRKKLLRFRAILSPKGGFMLCNRKWQVLGGPWRPSQKLHTDWYTRTHIKFVSPRISALIKNVILKWKVRKLADGSAVMSTRFYRVPRLRLYRGRMLRALAGLFIPGGIEGVFRRILGNFVRGDKGKGLRWTWTLKPHKDYSTLHFNLNVPVLQSRLLSSIMRIVNRFVPRRSRTGYHPPQLVAQQKRYAKNRQGTAVLKKGKKRYKIKVTYRKIRRRKHPLWLRVLVGLYQDFRFAARKD